MPASSFPRAHVSPARLHPVSSGHAVQVVPTPRESEVRLRSDVATHRMRRCARDLDDSLARHRQTTGRVAKVLDISRTIVDRWCSGERAVPLHEVEALPAPVAVDVLTRSLSRAMDRLPRTIEDPLQVDRQESANEAQLSFPWGEG